MSLEFFLLVFLLTFAPGLTKEGESFSYLFVSVFLKFEVLISPILFLDEYRESNRVVNGGRRH